MDGRPNRGSKVAFSNFSAVVWIGPLSSGTSGTSEVYNSIKSGNILG